MILRTWPRVTSAALAFIPVAMLVLMIVTIIVRSMPAINGVQEHAVGVVVTPIGFGELVDTTFSSKFLTGVSHYGLVPAIWGSVELLVIAMALGIPVSLAMAVCAGEIAPGAVGRIVRVLLGLMSGVPPIVYALMAVVFVAPFMVPKFTGNLNYAAVDPTKVGVAPDAWPPAGVPWNAGAFPWDPTGANSSVLLAGILLALLVVPFMAPLMEDALRNVPGEPKDASLALGASRWYTLVHITLPRSLAGITSAIRLGALKVLGDVMIGLFVVGLAATEIPNPPWDALERTAPLTAEGAGLIGGFYGPGSCSPSDCAVGYFSGAVLLVMAFIVVAVTIAFEWHFRRKYVS